MAKYKIICNTNPEIWEENFFVVGVMKPFGYILVSNLDENEIIIPEEIMKSTGAGCLEAMRLLRDAYYALRSEEGVYNFRIALVDDEGRIEELSSEFKADPDW